MITIISAKCVGIQAVPVKVEVDISTGIGIHLVGLADAAVKESLLRTVTALQSSGFKVPGKKMVINLAPADMRKQGTGYDLPIALGIIAASGQACMSGLENYAVMGELGLDGSLRGVPGVLPVVDMAAREGLSGCILPSESVAEALDYGGTGILGAGSLAEAVDILCGRSGGSLTVKPAPSGPVREDADIMDFSEIIGQDGAKRGLEIAVAGGHNLLMIGPPGAGKSSLAKASAALLPPMGRDEAALVSKIYSVAGLNPGGLMRKRPFRAPHHSASLAALIGGGNGDSIMPGEISLAHAGILFLDEFVHFPKAATEALRAPLEDRKVVISRLRSRVEFPASFMLIAAANPCPCGYYGDGDRCTCTPGQRRQYLSHLSGPIMDRLDVQLMVESVPAADLVDRKPSGVRETSAQVAERVAAARRIQMERLKGEGIFTNAEMTSRQVRKHCRLSEECKSVLERIIGRLGLSARAYVRIIKLARTIADLQAAGEIRPEHIAEAASYRFLDRQKLF